MQRYAPVEDRTIGELVATASRDISVLIHKEVELAKAEIKSELAASGKGVGGLGGAVFIGFPALLLLGTGIGLVIGTTGVGIAVGLAIAGAVLSAMGVLLILGGVFQLSKLEPPQQAIRSIQTDLQVVRGGQVVDPEHEIRVASQLQ